MNTFLVTTVERPKNSRCWILLLGLCFGLNGCLRTTIRSGRMPGDAAFGWEGRWHHAFFLGQYERSAPIAPQRLCPQGWAELDSELDPLQTAIAIVTLGIYTPSTVSVICEANEQAPISEELTEQSPESNASNENNAK